MHTFNTFEKALQSRIIKVIPGDAAAEFAVHEHLFNDCGSPSLKLLVSGTWRESSEGVIRWSDFDQETTIRVLQFLYYQDYTNPTPRLLAPLDGEEQHGTEDVANSRESADRDSDIGEAAPTGDLEGPGHVAPHEFFFQQSNLEPDLEVQRSEYRPLTPIDKILDSSDDSPSAIKVSKPDEHPHEQYSYQECFLAHAHVYRFALYHSLHQLQRLALKRLTSLLQRVDFAMVHAEVEIAVLVESVYDQIPAEETPASLRAILAHFVAIHFTSLCKGKLAELFHAGGDFTADVSERLVRRIKAGDALLESLQTRLHDFGTQSRLIMESSRSGKKKFRY